MTERRTLTAQDWIAGAFRALALNGIGAVKAEPLARDLGVSKGSFYWHFRSVPLLHQAMLDTWQAEATEAIIGAVEAGGGGAKARLTRLITLATAEAHDPFSGFGLEAAIRAWARYDPMAQAVQARIDQRRIGYLSELFQQAGMEPAVAAANARLLFAALVGLQAMGKDLGPGPTDEMLALLALLTGGATGAQAAPRS